MTGPTIASCNKRKVVNRGTCKYINGIGEVSGNDVDMGRILGNANVANAAKVAAKATGFPLDGVQDIVGALDMFDPNMKVPGFKSALGACYSGFPTICGGPKINIFGGRGSGANALALMGNFVGEGSSRTGSVISIKVADGGSGYLYPPFVEVVDNCKQGYGAHAQAILQEAKPTSPDKRSKLFLIILSTLKLEKNVNILDTPPKTPVIIPEILSMTPFRIPPTN